MAAYILYRLAVAFITILPWRILYWLSDLVAFFLYRVIKYRRDVVENQLATCFPELNHDQLKKLAKDAYQNLADIFVESFKSPSFTPESLKKRYRVVNPEVVNDLSKKHKGIIVTSAHFNNWEWGTMAITLFLDPIVYGIYKPIANKRINDFVNGIRHSYGTRLMPLNKTRLLFENPPKESSMFVFVADQSPSNMRDAIWLNFLGKETACLHGPEKYHKMTGNPVVHLHIYRVKRGYYEVYLTQIDTSAEKGITQQYMALVGKDIRKYPASWLRTHKRWKRRKEEAEEQYKKLEKLKEKR